MAQKRFGGHVARLHNYEFMLRARLRIKLF